MRPFIYLLYFNVEVTANLTANDLHHSHPNCEKEAEGGTCKSDPVYMSIVCGKTFCDGMDKKILLLLIIISEHRNTKKCIEITYYF